MTCGRRNRRVFGTRSRHLRGKRVLGQYMVSLGNPRVSLPMRLPNQWRMWEGLDACMSRKARK